MTERAGDRAPTFLRRTRIAAAACAVVAGMLGLSGCMPEVEPEPSAVAPVEVQEADDVTRFLSAVDGDTIRTSEGTVRLIGIDTPERGECGYEEALHLFEALLSAGDPITLQFPTGQNDRDSYDRLLRYVLTDVGEDLGMMQIEAGHAVARFDSTDGYPAHPSEAAYRAAQTASLGPAGDVVTVACEEQAGERVSDSAAEATPQVAESESTEQSSTNYWWMQYDSCAKLKRNQVGHPTGPFARDNPDHAQLYDWFANQTGNRGDGDGDGLACE